MADQKKVLRLLKTARGQIDGIIKMVEEDRYCKHCVNTAHTQEEREKKIDELVDMLGKILK